MISNEYFRQLFFKLLFIKDFRPVTTGTIIMKNYIPFITKNHTSKGTKT
jgi:hypothetical protein